MAPISNLRFSLGDTIRSILAYGKKLRYNHAVSPLDLSPTIATGVPAARVEAELWRSTLAIVVGALLCLGLAAGLAYFFGRRIARSNTALAGSATELASNREISAPMATTIREVSDVSQAFVRAIA